MSVFFLGLDSLANFWTSLYFMFVSRDWRFIVGGSYIIMTVALLFNLLLQAESPKFLYSVRNFKKLRQVLTYMARQNGVLSSDETFDYKFRVEVEGDTTKDVDSEEVNMLRDSED